MTIRTRRFISKKRSCSCSMPGVWRAVAFMTGAVVVFHSPRSCAHVAKTMDLNAYYRGLARQENCAGNASVPVVSSLLQEKHSIFGGTKQLEKCLYYVVENYQPKFIVIANSCVAGVIGDDVEAVAKDVEAICHVPILTVPCYGFLDGEYYAGFMYTTLGIIDRFMQPALLREPNTVLLLGDQGGPQAPYARELEHLLAYFNLKVLGQFPSYTAFTDLPRISRASLAILMGGQGPTSTCLTTVAQKLQAKVGMPYFDGGYPLGWSGTRAWLENLGEYLHKEQAANTAIIQEQQRLTQAVMSGKSKLRKKKVVFCMGRLLDYFQPQWVLEIIKLLELQLTGIVIFDSYTPEDAARVREELSKLTAAPIYSQQAGTDLLETADLILTTHEIFDNDKQLFLPMLPSIGVGGILDFVSKMRRALARHGHKGGIIYG
jgi:nitrogenase molybdenum-iron protein alpha chain